MHLWNSPCIYSLSHIHTQIVYIAVNAMWAPDRQVKQRDSVAASYSLLSPVHWCFQDVCPTLTALWSLTIVVTQRSLFVCLSGQQRSCSGMFVITGQVSPLTDDAGVEKWLGSSLCVPPLAERARPPGPLLWLPDNMSGVASRDLVLLILWQKTTLKGNSGSYKYLGTKELYRVCCKRIYSR